MPFLSGAALIERYTVHAEFASKVDERGVSPHGRVILASLDGVGRGSVSTHGTLEHCSSFMVASGPNDEYDALSSIVFACTTLRGSEPSLRGMPLTW